MQVASTYAFLHRVLDKAYENLKERDPEFHMKLGGDRDEPHFAHNSWRRLAATGDSRGGRARGQEVLEGGRRATDGLAPSQALERDEVALRGARREGDPRENDRDDLSGDGVWRDLAYGHGRCFARRAFTAAGAVFGRYPPRYVLTTSTFNEDIPQLCDTVVAPARGSGAILRLRVDRRGVRTIIWRTASHYSFPFSMPCCSTRRRCWRRTDRLLALGRYRVVLCRRPRAE